MQGRPLPGLPAPARHAGDSGALAGFRCAGSEIDLLFVRGPEAGAAHLTLDGSVRVVDLFHPMLERYGKQGPLTINGIHLNEQGNHEVAKIAMASMFPLERAPETDRWLALAKARLHACEQERDAAMQKRSPASRSASPLQGRSPRP